ncbi:peptidylprolyl isomerase [Roseivirga sp.]|uniref:peptidylprolyl isomerase n=1 Tax=Roseivirga sp. TaxID=1964215 RepID=UPI003B8B4A5E
MRIVCAFLLCFLSISQAIAYQSNNVVLATIDDVEISSGELLYAYNKTNASNDSLNYDSLLNYLNQYINFKLKVLEARAEGFDTLTALKTELSGYISQIKKPYLSSTSTEKDLVKEVYNRMLVEVEAAHILIPVKPDALPKDSLKAYKLIDSLRVAATSRAKFEELAKRYSKDGSAPNGGNLGWFSALDMVSPFEDAAYATQVSEVSKIVRTRFGYHILHINRKRSSKGKLKTAHIFFAHSNNRNIETETLAKTVYDSLQSGADWNEMARTYSEDSKTKMNGGELPLARIKQLPDDYMDIAYSLNKVGEFSAPQKTRFGWHIVRLDLQEPIPSLKVLEAQIIQALKNSSRNNLDEQQVLKKLKEENGYSKNSENYELLITALAEPNSNQLDKLKTSTLFSIGNKRISGLEFINFLPSQNISFKADILESFYKDFERQKIISYEDSIAPTKYPSHGYLLKEYEEGLLLFEVMQKRVWNKAMEDTIGTQRYFERNIKQYRVEKRYQLQTINGLPDNRVKLLKEAYEQNKDVENLEALAKEILTDSEVSKLKIVKRTVKASEISNFDSNGLETGNWGFDKARNEHYLIEKVIPDGYYDFNEVRGLVISDYQDFLDREWVNTLRKKRSVVINKRALKKLASIE